MELPIQTYSLANKVVFVAGSGRSGTTWLQEIINYRNDFRMIFEPFHTEKVDVLKDWNPRQYLRAECALEKYLRPAMDILSGRIKNDWVDQLGGKGSSGKLLIKDIRANLFLPFLKHHFPSVNLVFIMRHPCAVLNSITKLGWGSALEVTLWQEELLKDHLNDLYEDILACDDEFEKLVWMWCIENYVPLKDLKKRDVHVVLYEDLVVRAEDEIRRIFGFLDYKYTEDVFDAVIKPSSLSTELSAITTGRSVLASWQQEMSLSQVEIIMTILRRFGLDAIYSLQAMPLVRGHEVLDALKR